MAAKKVQRGLGRGLGALLGDVVEQQAAQEAVQSEKPAPAAKPSAPVDEVKLLPVGLIDPNLDQPRRTFKEDALEELAQSIRSVGVLQPIIVAEASGRYTIIAGERRYRAARLAELEKIPAIVRNWDEQKRLEAALIENLQRDDLNPIDEAMGVKGLMDQTGMTQEEAASRLGRSRPALANLLRLLTLHPMVRQLLVEGKLSAGHGRALAGVDEKRQVQLANLTVQQGWSVRQLERICAQPPEKEEKPQPRKDAQLKELETMARDLFGTRVKLDGDFSSGKITLSYYSADDLQRIWDVLEMARRAAE